MDRFTVDQLAKLAWVSVRTLHHYDHIGLLKPAERSESKYRYYGKAELLRLQQILFYRELDVPLARIAEILDDPDFDTLEALRAHREELLRRKDRMGQLLDTIDRTIEQLNEKNEPMNYEEMYKGFTKEQAEAYETEAKERWGAGRVEESKQRVLNMTKGQWEALQQEGDAINRGLVECMHLSPSDPRVQELVKRHHAMIGNFYTVLPEIYRSLASMYVEDERFRAFYDNYKPGLAAFLKAGMEKFLDDGTGR